MNHKTFKITSLITLLLVIISGALYDIYIISYPNNIYIRFGLKLTPIILIIINVFSYFIIYKLQTYAILMLLGILFSMLGDIFMMMYIPIIPEYNNITFLIMGGTAFFIGRFIMSLAFCVYPFRTSAFCVYPFRTSEKCWVNIGFIKVIIYGFLTSVYLILTIYYFVTHIKDTLIKKLLPPYILIMGVQLFTALVRVYGFKIETISSQIFGVIGTLLFTISDTLLFLNLFIYDTYDKVSDVMAISIYWVGLYFLGISVVRSVNHYTETNNIYHVIPQFIRT